MTFQERLNDHLKIFSFFFSTKQSQMASCLNSVMVLNHFGGDSTFKRCTYCYLHHSKVLILDKDLIYPVHKKA